MVLSFYVLIISQWDSCNLLNMDTLYVKVLLLLHNISSLNSSKENTQAIPMWKTLFLPARGKTCPQM